MAKAVTSFVEKLLFIWTKYKYLWYTLLLVVSFICGYYYHKPPIQYVVSEKIVTKDVPVLSTKTNTVTEIQYVPKLNENDSDVDVRIDKPQVSVKVNGQDHKFNLVQDETQKFDKGKVVLDQNSTVVFDVKVPNRNELTVSTEAEINKSSIHPSVVTEKENGKFHYGAKYDMKDNELSGFVKYDVLKVYTD